MGPSAASFDSLPGEGGSEEVHMSKNPDIHEGPKVPYVTTNLRRAHTVAQGRNMRGQTNMGSRTTRERMALSLLRAKDSHEMLQKRPALKQLDIPHPTARDTFSGARGMNHFTVGNVGQNGKIFLRPVRNPSINEPRPSPSNTTTQFKPDSLHPHRRGSPEVDDSSRWSSSQISELRPERIPKQTSAEGAPTEPARRASDLQVNQHHLQRAISFSTISEQRSMSRAGGDGELRVFIDRPDDRPKSADGPLQQPLEMQIPHYKLGIPQIDSEDHLLHESMHSINAWRSKPAYLDDPHRPSFATSMFSGVSAMDFSRNSAVSPDPVLYDLKDPIKPSIFETLVTVMDDESVVRYAPGTRNISAATPARIVAQISSESFMDYELVSDFFLTFRPYLSTGSLLSLLLARLQWAINRPQEDGRIIRIRTFAALRHWILNYFVDDFVPDFKLRTHFCETINRLYDSVKARQGGGMSDLKILIDLKRCWHGKSSAYWEIQDQHIIYQSPDHPIDPGADMAIGSDELQNIAASHTAQDSSVGETFHPLPMAHHDRNNSSATAKSMPVSAESDWSIHAMSCSLPPKSPKRQSVPHSSTKGPHPVPMIPMKPLPLPQDPSSPLSPMGSRRHPFYTHAHKRSGSFSDSVRDDRTPLSLLKLDHKSSFSSQEPLNLGSLIRGELYPPVESFMTMMAPPSPPLLSSTGITKADQRNTNVDGQFKPASSTSGVKKTIIGSIRRALHSKNGGQTVNSRAANGPPTRGKTSALPNNVGFGADLYRDKKSALPAKRPTRIDVLCEEALRQYRQLISDHVDSHTEHEESKQSGGSGLATQQSPHIAPYSQRARSQITGGSQSIVIMDGTGIGIPLMSGAVPMPLPSGLEQPPRFLTAENSPATLRAPSILASSRGSTLGADEYSLPIYYEETSRRASRRTSMFLTPSGTSATRRSMSVERGSSSWKRPSPSIGLRKYASFQSGISRHRLAMGSEASSVAESTTTQDYLDRPAMPTLRRRPGGDLRQMRGGPHAQSRPDSGSFRSDMSYRSSIAESTGTSSENFKARPQTSLVPPNPRFSLMNARSSQNVRRSFEAAIAKFAEIPDDSDGGIESTLLKLEGKWKKPSSSNVEDVPGPAHPQHGLYDGGTRAPVAKSESLGNTLTYSQVRTRIVTSGPSSESLVDSEDSYCSIPLLERGLTDESMKKPGTLHTGPRRFRHSFASNRDLSDVESSHPSIDLVRKTDSIKCIPRGSTLPVPDASDFKSRTYRHSGLSSEISVDFIDPKEATDQRLSFDTQSLGESSLGIPPHPLGHPPSPPMTIQHPRSIASYTTSLNPVLAKAQPLTPDPSPINKGVKREKIPSADMQHVSGDILSRSEADRHVEPSVSPSKIHHVPFVLSCESQVLAQQFTLLEMAALGEVDWRDLVDMKWSNGPPFTTSWVQFLLEEERRGIDLVVGRFNLMVKWILSEIVLTQDIYDRARTLTKFIHTAAHARRMCNYATMLQIAIALSSTDCSRLRGTWALVPSEDKRLLKDMELLIQPVRNFHDLRVEMETANVQEGCIPFVGLYVHDLTYNAQKPAQVATRNGEPLINFERYRTTAKIVKSLLRLIDASTKYKFEPVQGIIERVLWIASLTEEEIQTRSKLLG